MQFISAARIHDGHSWLAAGTTIEVANDGTIVELHSAPVDGTTMHEGIIAPGFVNVHCHLELSHMRGVATERTGLIPFLKNIPRYRNTFSEEVKKEARHRALADMLEAGIVAIGDIANTADTTDLRALDKMHFHTFVEALGFNEAGAHRAFSYAEQTYDAYASQQPCGSHALRQSIVPHAPYSVSSVLFRLIDAHQPGAVMCIHNQESEEENKFYMRKEGKVRELLHELGIDDGQFSPTGMSSLASYMKWLSPERSYIFVHNTYSDAADVACARALAGITHWCLCPNANLYIENRLPDVDMLMAQDVNICIGTDSLASNHQLCVLSELATIKEKYPHIGWETLLRWGTANGAQALHMQGSIGTIAPGKKPGLLAISNLDTGSKPAVKRIL